MLIWSRHIHIKGHEEESCVDISHFSIFSHCTCAIESEVIKAGQNRLHHSIPKHRIKQNLDFEYNHCATKWFLAVCCENWKLPKTSVWAFKIFLRFSYIIWSQFVHGF